MAATPEIDLRAIDISSRSPFDLAVAELTPSILWARSSTLSAVSFTESDALIPDAVNCAATLAAESRPYAVPLTA